MEKQYFQSVNPEYLKQITVENLIKGIPPAEDPVIDVITVRSRASDIPIIISGDGNFDSAYLADHLTTPKLEGL